MTTNLLFQHRYVAPRNPTSARTFLLLHGTGGDENDLLSTGRSIAPGMRLLSPRGRVLEHGMPRFFRRFAEGVFDVEDIKVRAEELAAFIRDAAAAYHFDPHQVIAFGYSNGANIAAATLLLHPEALAGAILLRPMVPLIPKPLPKLPGIPVLISAGQHDPMGNPAQIAKLTEILQTAGASVAVAAQQAGHNLVPADLDTARQWIASLQHDGIGNAT